MRIFHYITLILLGFVIIACDAPRNNPYDPEAGNYQGPGYQAGTIAGTVADLGNNPISGVLVLATPVYSGGITDSVGNYLIENIEPGDYNLICAPDGFLADTQSVTVSADQQSIIDFQLNALPVIYTYRLTSHFIHTGGSPPQYYEIHAQSFLSDPDGINDIDSVLIKTEEEDLYFTMSFNPDSTSSDSLFYFIHLNENSLPGQSIDTVKWNHFYVEVVDKSGCRKTSSSLTLTRIFDDYVITGYPSNGQTVQDPTLLLTWDPFGEQFFFTYTTSIFISNNDQLVWQQTGIPSTVDTLETDFYEPGDYYWRIAVLDEYGNSSISNKSLFTISP